MKYLELWYQAMAAQFGIVVETSRPQLFIQKLYAARRGSMDPALANLSIVQSPLVVGEVWILKRKEPTSEA
jgi:hypothetical protein